MTSRLMETPTDCAKHYGSRMNWPVVLDRFNNIVLPAGQVHAIQVCRRLAGPVQYELRRRWVRTPIIQNTATGSRMFLTAAPVAEMQMPVRLFGPSSPVQAIRTVHGCPIPLPTPGYPSRIWLDEPRPNALVDFDAVLTVVLDAADRSRHAAPSRSSSPGRRAQDRSLVLSHGEMRTPGKANRLSGVVNMLKGRQT